MMVASGTNSFAKEMAIRKRIASIFNKREEDFPSLTEYNDYLEEVEDMIFNLVEGIDVPAIEEKIAEYEKENAEQIMNAQACKAEEYAAALAASKGQPAQADSDVVRRLHALSFHVVSCLLKIFLRHHQVHCYFYFFDSMSQSSQVGVAAGAYAPAVAGGGIAQPRPIGMAPLPIPIGSNHEMQGCDINDEEMMKLRAERGIRAGGWTVELSRKRALEEAFSSIWI
ncbi:CDK-activating kinase assembly factor MAT1 [Camellia lanceoleosa]|uniref:CDK-activating kinase assembly factor MAT1 n=1 Tax=Camellia lanceoleosa TaxID=1840588 RepID=A0ACC0I5X5_9ERIC|nr:CDK-activating kinase assembly factor MAT1 [Camellia lanceoleosa]